MHALRRYIQGELDARGWRAHDLEKASGLSRQLISKLVNDDRDVLPQIPRTTTLEALAKAFNVTTAHVTTVAVEALGVADVKAPAVVHQIEAVSDDVLLRELLRRAESRSREGVELTPRQLTPVRIHRPIGMIEAELEVAEADLADFPKVPGSSAKSKRADLQVRIDALTAELQAARAAADHDQVSKRSS